MTSKRLFFSIFSIFQLLATLSFSTSCKTTNTLSDKGYEIQPQNQNSPEMELPEAPSKITFFFAGDIMAHSVNYKNKNFERIWADITPLLHSGDLCFANIEAPVAEKLEWSTYPQFNMHSEYVQAAIDAGFNVFSLANNHTNDQYLDGIKQTKKYFDSLESSKKGGITAAGLKEKSGDPLTYKIIEKNGWKILFVAITELLNRPDFASYIDYYPSTEKKRNQLKEELKKLRNENECDLFVLSIHTDETEYLLKISEKHAKFYRELISECGVNVVWANHPHVAKEWEKVSDRAFIMYATGNTISGQRTSPSFTKTETERDYTGDGLIMRMTFEKSKNIPPKITETKPFFITTYISPSWQFVVKLLDDDFIHSLTRAELPLWAEYLKKRKDTMEKLKEKSEILSRQQEIK